MGFTHFMQLVTFYNALPLKIGLNKCCNGSPLKIGLDKRCNGCNKLCNKSKRCS